MIAWPNKEPTGATRLQSTGGLVRYTIALVQSNPNLYRWAAERGQWSDPPSNDLAKAKSACDSHYRALIRAEADSLKEDS